MCEWIYEDWFKYVTDYVINLPLKVKSYNVLNWSDCNQIITWHELNYNIKIA